MSTHLTWLDGKGILTKGWGELNKFLHCYGRVHWWHVTVRMWLSCLVLFYELISIWRKFYSIIDIRIKILDYSRVCCLKFILQINWWNLRKKGCAIYQISRWGTVYLLETCSNFIREVELWRKELPEEKSFLI